jgi:hypothetical protein
MGCYPVGKSRLGKEMTEKSCSEEMHNGSDLNETDLQLIIYLRVHFEKNTGKLKNYKCILICNETVWLSSCTEW